MKKSGRPAYISAALLCALTGVLASFAGFALAQPSPEPLVFSHPYSDDPVFTQRDRYFIDLLNLALSKSDRAYRLEKVLLSTMSEKRSKLFIKSGRYNVHWLLANEELEMDLIPVRVPLYKGLIGWRLLVIHQANRGMFADINSLQQLKQYKATQGLGWPDSNILANNGFTLRFAVDWPGLLELVSKQQADYMPLAVNEVWSVSESLQKKQLLVEDHLVLHYPSAYYFFLNPQYKAHARALEKGLYAAIADGSFDELFVKTFGDAIERSKLSSRRKLSIENPFLSAQTPLHKPELWYRIQ